MSRQPASHGDSPEPVAGALTKFGDQSRLRPAPGHAQKAQKPVVQGWKAPGAVLKVASSGKAMYTQCHPDGTVAERSVHRWDEIWHGNWSLDKGDLKICIGPHVLLVPAGSNRGTEIQQGEPASLPADFFVLPVLPWPDLPVAPGERRALVKLPPHGTIYACELMAEGGLREYPLLSGWAGEHWGGRWSATGGRLSVKVGGYLWRDELRDNNGFFQGHETYAGQPHGTYPAVCVRLRPDQTHSALADAPDKERLFESNGYGFYIMHDSPHGYFSRLLEARKPSIGGGAPKRFAAKCVGKGFDTIALREIALASKFSSRDGLIAISDSFVLPDGERFGNFAGCRVQIMELGETDLGHFCRNTGPMPQEDVLEVARDLSGALAAMHEKYKHVHSDVRHANVIGCRTGSQLSWRLADFNVATRIDLLTGWAAYRGGTEICQSPTLVRRLDGPRERRLTKTSDDVWALGLLLAQCSSGELLPLGKRVTGEVADELISNSPGEVSRIIRGCLTPTGNERSSAKDVYLQAVAGLARVLAAPRESR